MISSFLEWDKTLTDLVSGKKMLDIKHIDADLCMQITFTDKSFIIVEAVPAGDGKFMPLFHLCDELGNLVDYQK